MARRLTHTKRYTPNQTTKIGKDDDAETPFWLIRKQVRQRLYTQQPHLSPAEIERRVDRIIQRGLKAAA
ncbi:MAG: hypothetical protein ABL931_00150 [Usitatibacteraceae bacterium]